MRFLLSWIYAQNPCAGIGLTVWADCTRAAVRALVQVSAAMLAGA